MERGKIGTRKHERYETARKKAEDLKSFVFFLRSSSCFRVPELYAAKSEHESTKDTKLLEEKLKI